MRVVSAARASEHRIRDQLGEIHRTLFERTALVEAREEEQVVDQHAHAPGLLLDAAGGEHHVLLGHDRVAAEQLGVAAHRGQGGAQLVRCVGDEVTQALLVGGTLRERRLQLAEHVVDGQAEPAHLGLLGGGRDALAEVAGGGACGPAHAIERAQSAADDEPRRHQDDDGDRRSRDQLEDEQLRQSGGDVIQWHSDDQQVTAVATVLRAHGVDVHTERGVGTDTGALDGEVCLRRQRRGECQRGGGVVAAGPGGSPSERACCRSARRSPAKVPGGKVVMLGA